MKRFSFISIFGLFINLSICGQQGEILKSEAIMYEGQGNYAKAAGIYESASEAYLNENITDTLCIFKAGQSYVRSKQYPKAIEPLKKCVELNYNKPDLYYALSQAYEGLKDYENAITILNRGALIFSSENNEFNKRLGYVFFKSRKYKEAAGSLEKVLEQHPSDKNALFMYGSSLEKLKKYDEAITALEKLLELKNNDKKAILTLGMVYFKQADFLSKQEKKKYERIKTPSRVDYHNYTEKVKAIQTSGYSKALPLLERATEYYPTNQSVKSCIEVIKKKIK